MSREVGRSKKHLLLPVRTQAVATFTQPLPASWRRRCTAQLLSRSRQPGEEWGALRLPGEEWGALRLPGEEWGSVCVFTDGTVLGQEDSLSSLF